MGLKSKIYSWVVLALGKVHWRTRASIPPSELEVIRSLITKDYFVILTRRKNHLSTFFVNLADFVLTRRWGYWSHALMNLEDEVQSDTDFRLVEATGKGVHLSTFEEVFDVHSAVLLKPKKMSLTHWTALLDRAKDQLGKPYDTLFDIKDAGALSCVELVRYVLQGEPNYNDIFKNFEALISKHKNLSPQMLFDCDDFEVIYLIKV